MNTAVAKKEPNPLVTIYDELEKRTAQFQAALPAHIPVERFKRVVLTAIQHNPDLAHADKPSLFNSCMKAAQDGLLPDGQEGALVIFRTKIKVKGQDGKEVDRWIAMVQWMPMIKGIRKKVRNSGEIATFDAKVVYEKDAFEYTEGFEPSLHHKPFIDGDPGKVRAAYSIARLKSGEITFEVMSAFQIEKVRAISKQKDGPAWSQHYGEMCRKTVARRHSKVLPMSTDLDDLLRRDDDLYDMEGASDKAVAPPRPQLMDFNDYRSTTPVEQPPQPVSPSPAAEGQEGAAAPGEQQEAAPSEAEEEEYGAYHAREDGIKARDANVALASIPEHVRQLGLGDAWQDGWRNRDDEINQAAKALRRAKDGE